MDRKEYLSMSHNDRQKITDKIKEILSADGRVVFAYVFGSFLDSKSFRDIDVGIYFNKILKEEVLTKK